MSRVPTPRRYTFNENATFLVRRPFKMQGRSYDIGDPFSKHNTTISARSLRQLYEAGKIEYATGAATGTTDGTPGTDIAGTGAAATGSTSGGAPHYVKVSEDMSMDALRAIADNEGAERSNSKKGIIDSIIANRKAQAEQSGEE